MFKKNHNMVVKSGPNIMVLPLLDDLISCSTLANGKQNVFNHDLLIQINHFYLMSFSHSKFTTEIYFLVLLTLFGFYQDLLGTQSFEKCPLRVYLSRLTTFTLYVMVNSASTSFLTRTHAHPENPYIEVGWTHLKKGCTLT